MDAPRWLIDPCPPQVADDLAAGLGVHRTTAEVLVRRGHATPGAARAFLELDGPLHDPMLLGDMAAACERIERAIAAAEQVARAAQLGMDVIVTDHHRPGDALPECPLVCTRPSEYPFPELAGTGVVFKLAQALFARAGRDPAALEAHLDLVALATIADVVPLIDENRGLVRAGLRRLARTTRPGLRALMATAKVDRARIGASDVGFRLAPRINAAGRLCHPGEALELLLTTDDARARALATRLEGLNRERQMVEDTMLREAIEQLEARGAGF